MLRRIKIQCLLRPAIIVQTNDNGNKPLMKKCVEQ